MKPNTARAIVGVTIMLSSFSLLAQETAAQRHAMATNQLKEIAADISLQCLTDIRTLEDWKKQRPELRRQLLEMLGLDPLPARTSLKAQITGRLERDGHPVGWTESGGIKLASSPERLDEIRRQISWARTYELPLHEMRMIEPRITKDVVTVLSTENSVKSRISYGGTAPKNVRREANRWLKVLARERACQ